MFGAVVLCAWGRVEGPPRSPLAATLRDLIIKPVPPDGVLPFWHPHRRLPMILRGPDYIEDLLNDTRTIQP